jgi:recombination protein RecR
MDSFNRLEEIFRKFPGIGPRQAKRFVYHLLTQTDIDIDDFANHLKNIKSQTVLCESCCRFYTIKAGVDKNLNTICNICSDQNRDNSLLMVVSKDIDLLTIEKSKAFNGLYFVLGGNIPILEDFPQDKIRQKELVKKVNLLSQSNTLKEIIIATSINPEGEHTAMYISNILRPLITTSGKNIQNIKITTLGRGLSSGSELEYSDGDTLKSALENRKVAR